MTTGRWKRGALNGFILSALVAGGWLAGCGGGLHKGVVAARGSGVISAGVFLPSSTPFGKTYGEWGDEWWKWILSIPPGDNPNLDKTGEK